MKYTIHSYYISIKLNHPIFNSNQLLIIENPIYTIFCSTLRTTKPFAIIMPLLYKIKKEFKTYFDRIRNEKVKINLLQAIPFWMASFITGLIAVAYAKLFSLAEKSSFYIILHLKWGIFIITPVCFMLAWWLVKKFAPFSRGSGIPQVMAALELSKPGDQHKTEFLLSLKVAIIKIISSIILVTGGGAIGREGPTIQIAGSIFRKINSILPAWWPKISRKNMIMTGAAAGLAAAFNTPLGGIVFTVEELTKTHISFFKTALFSAVIIAGLTAEAIIGPYLYLGYPDANGKSMFVFLCIIIVAVIAGITASLMCKAILKIFAWKKKFKKTFQHILYLLVSSLFIALIAYFVSEEVLGSGKDLMTHALFTGDKYVHWYTPLIRIAGPLLSFTSGAAGGIFAPALSTGASIGSFISYVFGLTDGNANLLILAGMVAFLTGVTRTPFTSSILVLEMTDRHNLILQLMMAGLVANIVSMIIDKHSFYDHLKNQYLTELSHPE